MGLSDLIAPSVLTVCWVFFYHPSLRHMNQSWRGTVVHWWLVGLGVVKPQTGSSSSLFFSVVSCKLTACVYPPSAWRLWCHRCVCVWSTTISCLLAFTQRTDGQWLCDLLYWLSDRQTMWWWSDVQCGYSYWSACFCIDVTSKLLSDPKCFSSYLVSEVWCHNSVSSAEMLQFSTDELCLYLIQCSGGFRIIARQGWVMVGAPQRALYHTWYGVHCII